jgi:hypothetical protein
MASFIDGLILLGLSCLSLIVIAKISKTSNVLLTLTEIFVASSWLYMIFTRCLIGSSLGEWACDLRLGHPSQKAGIKYGLRVTVRSTLIVCTGLVILPLFSLIIGDDLAGRISGLNLYSLK